MNRFSFFLFILIFQFVITGPLFADINSWVDENGVRHYSGSPPEKPEGTYDVIEEVEPGEQTPRDYQTGQDDLQKLIEQRKEREAAEKKERMLQRQKAEKAEKIKSAYQALRNLENLVAGDFEWDEYGRLLADAKTKLAALEEIPEVDDIKKPLTEAYENYAIVPELKRLEMTGQKKGVNEQIRRMNEKLGTAAPENYYKATPVFWQHAADKINNAGITP